MNTRRFRIYTISADILILSVSFVFMTWLKPAGIKSYIPSHLSIFVILAAIWVFVSLLNGKIGRGQIVNIRSLFFRVISSNIISVSLPTLFMYTVREVGFSRTVVLGTALTATILELVAGTLWIAFSKAVVQEPEYPKLSEREMVARSHPENDNFFSPDPYLEARLQMGCQPACATALASMVSPAEGSRLAVVSTDDSFNIKNLTSGDYSCIINLRVMNTIRKLDDFLDCVNARLTGDGVYICIVETMEQRSKRLKRKLTPWLYYPLAPFDFFFMRVLPRLRITRGVWQFLSGGMNPPLSRAESLGRLCRAGFFIRQEKFTGSLLCIKAQRRAEPMPVNGSGYGMIIALPRIGWNGKTFNVYKLRTMHPYSEFIQDYVYEIHDLQEGGKLKHDFRITSWGRFCRRIWLDELPMIVNLLKGDMKMVGVRPLSAHYFNLYSKELRKRRIKYKPGLIPPFYVDMPSDLEAIQRSEIKYLDAWDHHPITTDIRYFFRSIYNILLRRARSN